MEFSARTKITCQVICSNAENPEQWLCLIDLVAHYGTLNGTNSIILISDTVQAQGNNSGTAYGFRNQTLVWVSDTAPTNAASLCSSSQSSCCSPGSATCSTASDPSVESHVVSLWGTYHYGVIAIAMQQWRMIRLFSLSMSAWTLAGSADRAPCLKSGHCRRSGACGPGQRGAQLWTATRQTLPGWMPPGRSLSP